MRQTQALEDAQLEDVSMRFDALLNVQCNDSDVDRPGVRDFDASPCLSILRHLKTRRTLSNMR